MLAGGPLFPANGNQCRPISEQERATLAGQTLTPSVQERLSSASGATQIRVLKPKTAATMEAREGRLNVQVDELGKILSIWCDISSKRE
jgi:Peptidase inhibitor I78 family